MSPSNSSASMQDFLAQRGLTPATVTVPQLIESMLEFYRTVRATGLINDPQADMLLFQWGVFDWGQGEHYEIDLTRQFIASGAFDDDTISQLRFTAYFAPTPELRAISVSNRWCDSIADIDSFSAFIHGSAAYHAVSPMKPLRVSLHWGKV